MAAGLVALFDDIAMLAKLAAASIDDMAAAGLDDAAAAAGRAGLKTAGVVIDDTAVTPRYVVGISPARELPIIGKIALGSLRNKLLFLLPAALILSTFAPWTITPILMAGGAFLCFEGAEKVIGALLGHAAASEQIAAADAQQLEDRQVAGAIRTDLILSGEIMAIALSSLADQPFLNQAIALTIVAVVMTAGVYGTVALIVRMDDIGLALARRPGRAIQAIGRGLVAAMPVVLSALANIGVAAMLWVGGQIIVHGLEEFHLTPIPGWVHHATGAAGSFGGVAAWIAGAFLSAVFGLIVGSLIAGALHLAPRRR